MSTLNEIKMLVVDVDGTMTDGGIYYDASGNELKKFNTRDAAGIFAARYAGIEIMVLTGRESFSVKKRMNELKVKLVYQGVSDKRAFLIDYMNCNGLSAKNVGYIGDDLNDLEPMKVVGFIACPGDACDEIKAISNYIAKANGGCGAVRECISYIMQERGDWDSAIAAVYSSNA